VGARIFAHVQTGPGAHPAFSTMGTGSFPGVKRPGRSADHPPPSRAEVKKEQSYTSTPPLGLRACYGVPLPSPVGAPSSATRCKVQWVFFSRHSTVARQSLGSWPFRVNARSVLSLRNYFRFGTFIYKQK
jgi:hypothetical protein